MAGKTAQKEPKISQIAKLALNPLKSDKRTEQMSIPPFWGDVGVKKWSPFLVSGTRSTIFLHLKTGTFAKSAQFWVPKNGTLSARNYNIFSRQHPLKMVE